MVPLDHLNAGGEAEMIELRYFVFDENNVTSPKTIYMILGNQDPIETSLHDLSDLALKLQSKDSISIIAEHRFTSSTPGPLSYMNIDQILNDFNLIARSLNSSIVAMGYGYSGALATWL